MENLPWEGARAVVRVIQFVISVQQVTCFAAEAALQERKQLSKACTCSCSGEWFMSLKMSVKDTASLPFNTQLHACHLIHSRSNCVPPERGIACDVWMSAHISVCCSISQLTATKTPTTVPLPFTERALERCRPSCQPFPALQSPSPSSSCAAVLQPQHGLPSPRQPPPTCPASAAASTSTRTSSPTPAPWSAS